MLKQFKLQLTDEGETEDDPESTGLGLTSTARTDAERSRRGDAVIDTTTNDTAPLESTMELDVVFGLLKNRRRRDVLHLLTENASEMHLGELAEQIAARECGKDVSQVDSQERKRVYIGLYQCHLPKLADVGVIEYNRPRGIIERGPTFDHASRYLPADESPVDGDASDRPPIESLATLLSTGRQLLCVTAR